MDENRNLQGETALPAPVRKKKASRWLKLRKSEDGAATIEFALVSIPFFLTLFGIIEQGMYFLVHRLIDIGVSQVAREVKTGQIHSGNYTKDSFKQHLCNKGVMAIFDCSKLIVDVRQVASWNNPGVPAENPDGSIDESQLDFNPGGPITINVIRAYYDWPTILDWERYGSGFANATPVKGMGTNGHRRVAGLAAFLNEP